MMAKAMSFAVTPGPSWPLTRTSIFFAGFCASVCVASTCSTSEVPIPKRSEEHTSELQSLMRISYAVFCLKKKKDNKHESHTNTQYNNYILPMLTNNIT